MRGNGVSIGLRAALAIFTIALFATSAWAASHQVLHSFQPNGSDGAYPEAGLIVDAGGNRYSTTYDGGTYNVGAVFELSPQEGGGWTEKVLYSFNPNGRDGAYPDGGLVLDGAGNLYGTTSEGGIHSGGTVFELSPNGSGGWTETVLHSFGNPATSDGIEPFAGLVFDRLGNLYGTTYGGGIHSWGTAFELSPNGSGGWTETVLHSFNLNGADGAEPRASLTVDAAGNLYGTTYEGGIHSWGTAFELSPNGGGGWTETVLHSFSLNGTDGALPTAGLVLDGAGNLYSTTSDGGIHYEGAVFELSPRQGGGWTETVLHSFGSTDTDGQSPQAGLVLDGAGNLYGSTPYGGIHHEGTVFELSPREGGGYTETVLHSFNLSGTGGAYLDAGLILDAAGNLYSTASRGGANSVGTVFELSPNGSGGWTEAVLYSFNFAGTDGANPYYGSLISDASGNFYGTTGTGGTYDSGIAFELTPNGSGGWTETVLHSFNFNGTDGALPTAGLVLDGAGNLYGTTVVGGIYGYGTAFELSPNGSGGWTETVLHSFGNPATSDGIQPFAGLVFDPLGNLYGTTYEGGLYSWGTAFELSPNGGGGWTETVLYSFNFNGTDGALPTAGLVLDGAGNLYGTTSDGGIHYEGAVFELSPRQGGGWTETVLHSFGSTDTDGQYPQAGLVLDGAGNLYGTTSDGGIHYEGTVFELSPREGGGYTETVLHNFYPPSGDGGFPYAGLIFDGAGNLYGTTTDGGVGNAGSVFEMTPNGSGGWAETVLHNFYPPSGDGGFPEAGLIRDGAGNLYGTTYSGGGAYNAGTVFEVGP